LTPTDRLAIDASMASAFPDTGFSTPYSGTSSLEFDYNRHVVVGNVLQYERTASWTAFAALQLYYFPATAGVIYTNVPGSGSAFPGHEIWIDNLGKLRVRIMSNVTGGNYIGVIGTANVVDGKKHAIAYSYDGSSLAAGIKVYIDGALEATTVEHDALSASIVASGQSLYVGNQQQPTQNFNFTGVLSFFQIDNVVRSQAYIQSNFTGGAIPPAVGGQTDIRFLLNEGSGGVINDTSGNSHNGTPATATMWVP
jgi:hypothetical protein